MKLPGCRQPGSTIPVDDGDDDILVGMKRSRSSGYDTKAAEAKKNKRMKAAKDPSRAATLPPLRIQPLALAPPRDDTGGVAPSTSPPPLPKQPKMRFRGIPR